MSGLRLPLRLARREVRRRAGRTALVALLVALPVAGMTMAITLIRTDAETPLQRWERQNGQADAVVFSEDVPRLPAGSRTVEVRSRYERVKTVDGDREGVDVSDLPLNDRMTMGIYDLVDGRAPTRAGEVALASRLLDRLGVDVGEDLVLERPALELRVVGEVEPVGCLSCTSALFAPGEIPAAEVGEGFEDRRVLVELPAGTTGADLLALQEASLGTLQLRDVPSYLDQGNASRGEAVRWSLVLGALVLTVAGIVISAAFAVGARRQLVTLGQLSASGASPATVRSALVLQGTVTGIAGSVAGLVFAAVLLLFGQPLVEQILDRRIDGYTVRAVEVLAVVAIGVVAATVAALIPARTAARIPTLAALAGRRPLVPVSRRLVTWGFVSMAGGLSLLFIAALGSQSGSSGDLWAFVAILGGVGELLGACALAPAVVARLEPLARRLRGSLRLGARSLARHRARTGAVVSAVAAAGALAVAAGGLMLGSEALDGVETDIPDDVLVVERYDEVGSVDGALDVDLRAALDDALPGARAIPVRGMTQTRDDPGDALWQVAPAGDPFRFDGAQMWDRALLADDALLDAIRVGPSVRDGLADTGVVVLTSMSGPRLLEGDVSVTLPDGRAIPALAVPHRFTPGYSSGILLTEAVVADLDLDVRTIASLFETPDPFTAAQRGDIEDLMYDAASGGADGSFVSIQWSSPDSGPSPFQLELILTGVALVFSLFVVGVSLALAAAESKDERDVLTIAGAPPSTLARAAGARAWLLAVIGTVMAVPVGFLPVVVFSWASDRNGLSLQGFPIVFPTRTVLLLVIAVPLAVALASWSSSAVAQRLRPVRVSTAVFE